MKTKLRRITSMVLTISMIASMIGIMPATAATGESFSQIKGSESSSSNTANYEYHTVTKDTTYTTVDETTATVSSTETYNDDDSNAYVSVSKTIEGSRTNENAFDITLKVVTSDDIQEIPTSADAAVVLVFDTSYSMRYVVDGNSTETATNYADSRMYMAEEATKTFVADFASSANGAQRMVAVVDFAQYVYDFQGWTDVASASNLNTVTKFIDNLVPSDLGGTNIDAGLTKANDLVLSLKTSNPEITSVYVVLVTDGAPTYYYNNNTYTDSSPSGNSDASSQNIAYYDPTIIATNDAAAMVRNNALLYTVAFSESNNAAYYAGSKTSSTGKTTTIDSWLSSDIASDPDMSYNATDGETLKITLSSIIERIAQLASAWEVTDPMGDFINFTAGSITGTNNATVDTDGTITWKLRNDVADYDSNAKTYTYEMSYSITLNTAGAGFAENTYYLTNGHTFLNYCFVDDATDVTEEVATHIADFNVPAVKGEWPVYGYTVKHWTQVTDPEDYNNAGVELVNGKYYEEVTRDRIENTDTKKNISVTVYANDYTNHYFTGISGASQTATINAPGTVFNFYYNKDTTTATEYHIYETVTYTEESPDGVTTSYTDDYPSGNLYIGSTYTADEVPVTTYDLYKIVVISNGKTNTYTNKSSVDLDVIAQTYVEGEEQNNQFYFYYTRDDEQREVSVTVNHLYTEYGWVLNSDNKYVSGVVSEFEGTADQSGTMTYGSPYTVVTDDSFDGTIKEGYALVSADSSKLGQFTPTTEGIEIDLHYTKAANIDDLKEADITVIHIYEVETTEIVNDVPTTLDPVEEDRDTITVENAYVGEDYTALLKPSSDDLPHSYTEHNYKDAELTIENIGEGSYVITIHYLRSWNKTETTSVTVEHQYTLYKGEIVTDELSEDFGSYVINQYAMPDMTWSETISTRIVDGETTPLYELQSFTATEGGAPAEATDAEKAVYAEYEMYGVDPSLTITLGEASDNKIIIYYQDLQELDEAAAVNVVHRYRTVTQYYDGSTSVQYDYTEYVTDESYNDSYTTGHVGELYTVTDFYYTSNEVGGYSLANDKTEADFYVTLTGNTQTITINYQRTVYDYSDTDVVVNHHFVTRASYIDNNGTLVTLEPVTPEDWVIYGEATDVDDNGQPLYTGMSYSAAGQIDNTLFGDGAYTPASDNVSSISRLASSGNQIDLYYYLDDTSALTDVNLQVIHVYETYEYELEGTDYNREYTEDYRTGDDTIISGYYAGQYYTLATLAEGNYTVNSTKTDSDWANRLLVASTDPEATVDNVIYIYYEKMAENEEIPVTATLTVNHVYVTEYMSGKPSTTSFNEVDDSHTYLSFVGVNYPVSTVIKRDFSLRDFDTEHTVTEVTENTSYKVLLDSATNEITFYYVRTVDDRTEMTVAVYHNYFYYDTEGNPVSEGAGTVDYPTVYLHEGTYTPDGEFFYAPVADAGEYEYFFTDGTLTVSEGEAASYEVGTAVELAKGNSYVIVMNYCREVEVDDDDNGGGGGGGSTSTYYTLITTYVDEDGNTLASSTSSRVKKGNTYSTTQKSISGYTFVTTSGDATSGTMNSNKSVVYIYTPSTVDIPDEDIPLVDIPDEDIPLVEIPDEDIPLVEIPDEDIPLVEIPEEEIPLTDIPQTGDNRNVFPVALTAVLSAAGLAVLAKQELDEKKRKSEN